jgi:hypothetical protein
MSCDISSTWSEEDLFGDLDPTGGDFTIRIEDDFSEAEGDSENKVLKHKIKILTRVGQYVSPLDRHFYLMHSREIATIIFHEKFMKDYKTQNIPYGPNIHLSHEVLDFPDGFGSEVWKKVYHSELEVSLDGYMEPKALFEVLTEDIFG